MFHISDPDNNTYIINWKTLCYHAENGKAGHIVAGDNDSKSLPILHGSQDWGKWSMMLKAYLRSKGLWAYVNGSKMADWTESDQQSYLDPKIEASIKTKLADKWKLCQEWETEDDKALGVITMKLSPMLSSYVKGDSRTTWDDLKTMFGTPGVQAILNWFNNAIAWRFPTNKSPSESINELLDIFGKMAVNVLGLIPPQPQAS